MIRPIYSIIEVCMWSVFFQTPWIFNPHFTLVIKYFHGHYIAINYCTVKTLAVKNLWQIWQITAFRQVLSPIFTISITFPMQMDFNSPKFFCQTSYSPYSPNFFTAKVFYCMVKFFSLTLANRILTIMI